MPRYLYTEFANAVDGRDGELNKWYDEVRVPDFLQHVAGAVSVERTVFTTSGPLARAWGYAPFRYLTMYEFDASDGDAATEALDEARKAGNLEPGGAFDQSSADAWLFEPMGVYMAVETDRVVPKYRMLKFSNPTEGQEERYNEWYNRKQIPENLIAVKGMISAERFRYVASGPGASTTQYAPCGYLAVYRIDSDEPDTLVTIFDEARAAGYLHPDPSYDMTTGVGWFFEVLGPKRAR
jgi:hypothetical protein